jgi:hypothetical protein
MADIDFGVTKKTTFADTFEDVIVEQLKKQYGVEGALANIDEEEIPEEETPDISMTGIVQRTDIVDSFEALVLEQFRKQQGGNSLPNLPIASFSYSTSPLEVIYTDTSTGGEATAWLWNFGEGATPTTSAEKGPHTVRYSTPGDKTVSLTVSNIAGESTDIQTIHLDAVLIGWWKGEDNAVDSVNGNTAVPGGNLQYADGQIDRCFKFLGDWSNGSLKIPHSVLYEFGSTGKFSIEFWFKYQSAYGLCFFGSVTPASDDYNNYWDSLCMRFKEDRSIELGSDQYSAAQVYTNMPADGTFYKIKIVYNGASRWEMYVNDILRVPSAGYATLPFTNNTDRLFRFYSEVMNGSSFDEIKIYNGML